MRMLEIYAGSAVLSQRFKKGGWQTTSLDINSAPAIDIVADALRWNPNDLHNEFEEEIAYIHGGPPCHEFSGLAYDYERIWDGDMRLVLRQLEIVKILRPRIWSLENVKMLQWLLGKAPYHYGPFFMWGYFPFEFMPKIPWTRSYKGTHLDRKAGNVRTNEPKSAEERAKYPPEFCEDVFKAVTKFYKSGYRRKESA